MPLILAIEPDRRQAAQLKALARVRLDADLILADTTEGALEAIGDRVPDLVLVPALLSPQDDDALAAALRVIAAAAHVQTLTIPAFAAAPRAPARPAGMLAKLRREQAESTPDGCDPAIFAEQINAYLAEAAGHEMIEPEPPAEIPALAPPDPVEVEFAAKAAVAPAANEIDFGEFIAEPGSDDAEGEAIVLEPPPPESLALETLFQEVPAPVKWTPLPIAALQAWPQIDGVGAESGARHERPEWLELVESLRQDLERRRSDRTQPSAVEPPRTPARKKRHRDPPVPVQDEWGFFDPAQCGFAALLAKLDEITDSNDDAIS